MLKQPSKDWLLNWLVITMTVLVLKLKTENQMRMNWFVSWLFR
ncbi:Uncharacterised protein [Mycobacterium tuberculosis]|nr:Uncharacterised protein [Mycobacterium tuberculosis]